MGALAVVAVSFTACKKNEGNANFSNRSTAAADYTQSALPVVPVSGNITTNTTWSAGNVYELSGIVTVQDGATLTIEAGTYIKSSVNVAGTPNGVLVVAKNGSINAQGTENNPIVFTSRNLLDGNDATTAAPGDFGGVIIIGNAPVNLPNKSIEGLPTDAKFVFGGADAADNRGTFKFVRIEYAGFVLSPNNEVNGLTLGGVGSGTTIDHVQVSYGLDDAFEFFGGTVNPSNLVALACDDDQFDFDNGFNGTLTDAIAIADKNATHSFSGTKSDSNGIESDNNAPADDATFSLTPKTHPILNNVSIIGTENPSGISGFGYLFGVRERRGSEITLNNCIVTGYPTGISFDADANAALSSIGGTAVHGFSAAVIAANGAFQDLGGNTNDVNGSNANAFGIAQPWFNAPGSPATVSLPVWANGWTKLVY